MGATTFQTTAWGRTPEEAFRSARDRALWEHGHGGYTGTIAEKRSFVLFALPPRTKVSKVLDLVDGAQYASGLEYVRSDVARLERELPVAAPGTKRDVRSLLSEARARQRRFEREVSKFERKAGPLRALIERVQVVYDDKWGPACAFEVTVPSERAEYSRYQPQPKRGMKLFVFAGWASC